MKVNDHATPRCHRGVACAVEADHRGRRYVVWRTRGFGAWLLPAYGRPRQPNLHGPSPVGAVYHDARREQTGMV